MVESGESQPQATPPTAQLVDASALAKELVSGVFAQLQVQTPAQAPQTPAQRQSAFKAKTEEYKASGRLNEDVAPVMFDLIEAMKADLSAEQRESQAQAEARNKTAVIHSQIGSIIDRYADASKNPELIKELKTSIGAKVIDQYNKTPALLYRYQQTGEIDWTEMDKLIVPHVNKWSGGEDAEKPARGPAMKNNAPSGSSAEASATLSKDTLNDTQRDIYNAQVSFGIKNAGLKREDAEKKALELINRAESKKKSAKR